MAFHAARGDGAVEDNLVGEAGAVRPGIGSSKISDGQLEQTIIAPVQETLTHGTGTHNNLHAACFFFFLPEIFHLVPAAVAFFHGQVYTCIEKEFVAVWMKAAHDVGCFTRPCGQEMRCVLVLFKNIPVASAAGSRS